MSTCRNSLLAIQASQTAAVPYPLFSVPSPDQGDLGSGKASGTVTAPHLPVPRRGRAVIKDFLHLPHTGDPPGKRGEVAFSVLLLVSRS